MSKEEKGRKVLVESQGRMILSKDAAASKGATG